MAMNHPANGQPFNYNRCCKTCRHLTDKTRTAGGVKYKTTKCALDPDQRNLADKTETVWHAMPACIKHSPRNATSPRP